MVTAFAILAMFLIQDWAFHEMKFNCKTILRVWQLWLTSSTKWVSWMSHVPISPMTPDRWCVESSISILPNMFHLHSLAGSHTSVALGASQWTQKFWVLQNQIFFQIGFHVTRSVGARLEVIYWICSVWTKHFLVGSCAHNIANIPIKLERSEAETKVPEKWEPSTISKRRK